ncbi:MAG: hypothetical protein A2X42_01315 [Candidatus Margulisbacteria bacterium GWF2_38_17]|nr:MAG: hypothetical protein A2X43_12700 [Candidatus Margulisbacteria bacterium GWD2_39_127]OGI02090.1 MAG: hypothetical protein A2X42_01315 [Candidatus Margulisbacteria bacterium GWF2_38_17]OGI10467.1 MAG: hypothetical protein A2X41_06815 [Candidatus Margulisbacteria bacterium GWE2_39_32]
MVPIEKEYLIFDIGEEVIKLLHIDNKIQNIEFFKDNQFTNEKRKSLETSKRIKAYLLENTIETKTAFICISSKNIFIKITTLKTENSERLEFQINSYVQNNFPFALNEIELSYVILNEKEGTNNVNYRVMIAAVPKYLIEKYQYIIAEMGLIPSIITVAPLCVAALYNQINDVSDKSILCIDFGASKSDLIFIRNGEVSFSRSIAIGSDLLIKEIQDYYQVQLTEARKLKNEINFNALSGNYSYKLGKKDPVEVVEHVLDTLITDIKRTLGYYINNEQGNSIEKIYLFGGNAFLNNIDKYFEHKIGIATDLFPCDRDKIIATGINDSIAEAIDTTHSYLQAVNVLGFNKLLSDKNLINLLKEEAENYERKPSSPSKSYYKILSKNNNTRFLVVLYRYLVRFVVFSRPLSSYVNRFNLKKSLLFGPVVFAVMVGGYYAFLQANIHRMNNMVQKNQQQLALLSKKADEAINNTNTINEIRDEAKMFLFLHKKNVFSEFANYLVEYQGNNRITFVRIEFNKDKKETHIIGESKDGNNFAQFIKDIQKNPSVRSADIVYITQKDSLFEFELLIKVM